MKLNSCKSGGLGGFFGVSNSLGLGTRKNVTHNKFHIVLFVILLSGICKPSSSITTQVSLILALQRNNEIYKDIKLLTFRKLTFRKITLCPCDLLTYIFVSNLVFCTYYLLLLSGDVETNPGPDSVDGLTDSSDTCSTVSFDSLSSHLSNFHMNIQSIVPKLDLIRGEADAYDVLIISESWLKPTVPNDTVHNKNYLAPFRTDRPDRPGGGVVAYVRENIPCKRRPDLELRGLEAVWLELQIKSKKVLLGGFYRQPISNLGYMDLIKESTDRAYNTNIVDIIITGDFNYNMISNDNNKLKELTLEYNLNQLITFIRNKVINELRKSKNDYFEKLDNLLSSDNCDPKKFWKTSKQVLKDDADRWLRLNGPVIFSYFYCKCYLKLVLWSGTRKNGGHWLGFGAIHV